MHKFSYHKKYHYALKYFVMAFPLLIFILGLVSRNEMAYDFITFCSESLTDFANIDLNLWYQNLLDLLGLSGLYGNEYINIMLDYPLYILWVYIMDLILDIFAMVPKLAHKLLYKLGGGIDD